LILPAEKNRRSSTTLTSDLYAIDLDGRWSHAGLHATFANELTRRRKLYPSTFASDLAIVIDLRHTADYRAHDVGKRQALRALNKAKKFVNGVKGRTFHG
jgi:hypothetical protein